MPASRTKQALTAARRKEMFLRRAAGESMTSIAEAFGMSRQTLSKDFTRAYKAYLEEEKASADVWRRFQTDRLEQLLQAVWPDAVTGDVKANEQARKLIADLSQLNGWNAPVKAEVSGPDGAALLLDASQMGELNALMTLAGEDTEAAGEDAGEDG